MESASPASKIVPLGNHFRKRCTTMAKEKTVYV